MSFGKGMWAGWVAMFLVGIAVLLPAGATAQPAQPSTPTHEMPAFRAPAEETVVPGQIIVRYEEAVGASEQAALRRQENLEKKMELGLLGAEVVKVRGRSVGQAIRDLNARADVEYAEPNFKVYPTGFADEPRFSELWGLHNTGQAIEGSTGTANVDINAKEASARTQGSPTLQVAVIDDGVDFTHPDLSGRQWVNPGESGSGKETNGVDDDANGYVDDVNGWDFCHQDNTVHDDGDDAHGTHVSGTIAASVNSQGVVGVAPQVKIMGLKFLSGSGTGPGCNSTAGAIEAIGYAKKMGIKISNNSYGGGGFSQALKDAIDASGSLFVAAAGNGGSDGVGDNNDTTPMYPASYTSPNILSVAAVNNRGSLGGFSNYGKTSVDISAPGVSILSSVPGNGGQPAAVLSSVGISGKALTAGFGAEEIGTAAKQASFFGKAFQAIGRGSQQVVLVDDDGSHDGEFANVGPTVATAIQSATGSAPQTIQVGEGDGPSLSQLSGKTVVWSTGESFYSGFDSEINFIWNLTPADQTTLTNFLNGGGKLVVTGRDALYEIETSTFVTATLDLTVDADTFAETFTGAAGTAFAGESYAFDSVLADEFGVSHDGLAPASSTAKTQGGYDGTPAAWESWPGTSMASPHVAGTAALVASKYPSLLDQPTAIKKTIMDTGKPLAATAGKTVTGDMVDAQAALFPRVTAMAPINKGAPRGSNVTATFSEAMNATSVTGKTFTLVKDGTTRKTSATVSYDSTTEKATLNPSAKLAAKTVYKATVKGKSTGVKNTLGDPMFTSKVWKFKTGS